jgi:hypothetical protein
LHHFDGKFFKRVVSYPRPGNWAGPNFNSPRYNEKLKTAN